MSVRPDQENNIITGIIETESGNIIFSARNFKFTFMNPDFLINVLPSKLMKVDTFTGELLMKRLLQFIRVRT